MPCWAGDFAVEAFNQVEIAVRTSARHHPGELTHLPPFFSLEVQAGPPAAGSLGAGLAFVCGSSKLTALINVNPNRQGHVQVLLPET
jgi:hypothetical protein